MLRLPGFTGNPISFSDNDENDEDDEGNGNDTSNSADDNDGRRRRKRDDRESDDDNDEDSVSLSSRNRIEDGLELHLRMPDSSSSSSSSSSESDSDIHSESEEEEEEEEEKKPNPNLKRSKPVQQIVNRNLVKKQRTVVEEEEEESSDSLRLRRQRRHRQEEEDDEDYGGNDDDDMDNEAARLFSTRTGMENVTTLRDQGWANEIDAEDKFRDHRFQPIFHPSRAELEGLLLEGESYNAEHCFGCTHGDVSGVSVSADNWNTMVSMFMTMYPRIKPQEVFFQMYEFFCTKVIVRNKLGQAVDTSKIWSPHGIAKHFLEHTTDTTINTMVDLRKVQTLIRTEMDFNSIRINENTGRPIVNPKSASTLLTLFRIQDSLMKRKIKECNGFNPSWKLENRGYPHLHPYARVEFNNIYTDSLNMRA